MEELINRLVHCGLTYQNACALVLSYAYRADWIGLEEYIRSAEELSEEE